MSEPKTTTYEVINEENEAIYQSGSKDECVGVAKYVKETDDVKCRVVQVILV